MPCALLSTSRPVQRPAWSQLAREGRDFRKMKICTLTAASKGSFSSKNRKLTVGASAKADRRLLWRAKSSYIGSVKGQSASPRPASKSRRMAR